MKQAKSSDSMVNIAAIEFLQQLDQFSLAGSPVVDTAEVPHVIKAPIFHGNSLKVRLFNILTLLPLRIVRKSTMDYYTYQKQQNHEFRQEIALLHKRIDVLAQNNTRK